MTDVGGTSLSTDKNGAWVVEATWVASPTSQGTGTHTFSYRLTHFKFNGWWNFTPEGYPLWNDGSVSPFDIGFD